MEPPPPRAEGQETGPCGPSGRPSEVPCAQRGTPANRRGPPSSAGARVAATCPRRVPRGSSRFGPRRFYPAGGLLTTHMDFALTETQEISRKSVRDFAEQDIIPQPKACD